VVQRAKLAPNFEAQPLKTANAYRTIPLDSWLADDLRAYLLREHQDAKNPQAPLFPGRLTRQAGKALGRDVTDSADMFDWGRPIDENMVYKRYWLPALEALNLPHSRWHDHRHTFAVMSLAGDHYRDVSRWLGHSKISTTLDIYANVIASEDGSKAAPLPRPVAKSADNVVNLQSKRSG
jgi:integrase